jgi:MFS family permease
MRSGVIEDPARCMTAPAATRSPPAPTATARDILVLVALLAATTILSQFFRTALAVIAPELIRDLALTPRLLGLANGSFFASLLFAQVAVGIAFDRVGPRRTVGVLSVFMTLGAGLHAVAADGMQFVAARLVTGIGCAASFMSAVVLVSAWLPPARWSTGLSWVFGSSQLGILMAGAPLAYAASTVGWRQAFLGTALLAAAVGLLFALFVRDRPPGAPPPTAAADQPGALEGLRQILAIPQILPVFALFGVAYGSVATIAGLWAGPYLKDIHGLDAGTRGMVLTGMAAIQMAAVFAFGPLDRIFNTRKWIIVAGGTLTLALMTLLAALPAPPLSLAVTILTALSATSAYGTVVLAHMRAHFPNRLAGRGATTGNIAQLGGAALLPILTGFIPPLFGDTSRGYHADAYRLIFACLAGCLALGLAIYIVRARDIRPRDGG